MRITVEYCLLHCLTFLALCFAIVAIQVKLGVVLPQDGDHKFKKAWTLPAIEYAVEEVNRSGLLPNHELVIHYKDSMCSESFGPLMAVELYVEKNAHVFLGPVCNYAVAPVARFSAYWNIPLISAGALVMAFDDKSEYKYLTRIQGSFTKASGFILQVLELYSWSIVGLLFHNIGGQAGHSDCRFAVEPLFENFKNNGVIPWYKEFNENLPESYRIEDLLTEASQHARSKHLLYLPYSK